MMSIDRVRARTARGFWARALLAASILSAGFACWAAPAEAQGDQAAANFYRGKTVKILVGFGAGGSFDITARTIARHMGKHIPGNPTVIVENVPGAGSMLVMNQVYNSLPKDGTIMGTSAGPILSNQVFGNPAAQFDASKLRILGAPASIVHMLFVTKASGITSVEELRGPNAKTVKIGASAVGDPIYNSAMLAKEAVGLNFQMVTGYDGMAKTVLALEQGEVNATFNNIYELQGIYKAKIDSGEWRILAQSSEAQHPLAPKVPVLADLAKTPEDRQMLRLGAILPLKFGFLYYMAPGVPDERGRAMEQAFAKTLADKDYVADLTQAKLFPDPIAAAEVQKMVAEYVGMPDSMKARLKPIVQQSR